MMDRRSELAQCRPSDSCRRTDKSLLRMRLTSTPQRELVLSAESVKFLHFDETTRLDLAMLFSAFTLPFIAAYCYAIIVS